MLRVHIIYFDINTGYYPGFHHGVASLIGALKQQQHDVSFSHVTDTKSFSHVVRTIKKKKPQVIGFSFTTNQKKYVRDFLDTHPFPKRSIVVAGGVHCTLMKEKVFEEFPELEGICIGEADVALVTLCQKISTYNNYFDTPGFYFKRKNKIVKNPVPPLADINTLPFPDYSLFNYRKIISDNGGIFYMMLSRGCPYSCYYCCNHIFREIYPNREKYVRFLTPRRAIELIKNNIRLYPSTEKIIFSDDTFTVNHAWLKEFGVLYAREIHLPYLCNGRVENINQGVLTTLKDSGCVSLEFGVESGNEWVRGHLLNRYHSNDLIRRVFKLVHQNGIKTFSYNIIGFPFETKKMALDTLKLNFEIKPDFGKCFYFYPFPGTKLAQLTDEYGLLRKDFSNVSGYLHAPSVTPQYMSYRDMKSVFTSMQVFFYGRTILSKLKIPEVFKDMLLTILLVFKNPIYSFIDPYNQNKQLLHIRNRIRTTFVKYLR